MNLQPLKPHWRGPFVVVLSTPTAVKVAEIIPWIHHSQVKSGSLSGSASLIQPYHERSLSSTSEPFPGRTFLPMRQQETMNDETSALP
jgi:hypothetical protein